MIRYKLAVDTGGTFTDFCLMGENGELHIAKEPSIPEDPSRAVLAGIKNITQKTGVDPGQIDFILHGTTVATNAILERKGARLALITTRGFKDIIYIGRQNRPHLYNFWAVKPPPLLPRHLVLEVNERVLADGSVHLALEEKEIQSVILQVKEAGVESVAICLLHSYINPVHEAMLKNAIKEHLPHLSVTISAEILPEFREYERTSTTVINALVKPLMDKHISRLEKDLTTTGVKSELFIMQSSGGVITAPQAREQSARIALSGPAGGVLAGVHLAGLTGNKNLITADMGGTSMDICLINNGKSRFTTEGAIGGYPLRLPMLDIHTIGAGGGSVAWVDPGGALRVGPQSAGSVPGPACYGLGGEEPTVTDANLILGRLDPADLAGVKILKPELAARAVSEKIGAPLGLTLEQAAEGIIRVVNANMVRAMRLVSVQKGYDPRDFTLAPFGGACPLHAVELARELGIPRIMVPPHPGVASAWGMLSADVRHDYSLTRIVDLTPAVCAEINGEFARLTGQGREDLAREGFAEPEMSFNRFLDIRYQGQSYELTLSIPGNSLIEADIQIIIRRFHRLHQQNYGYCRENAPAEIVTLRLTATGALPKISPRLHTGAKEANISGTRQVYLSGEYRQVPVHARRQIGPGWHTEGPAIITQADATTLIWPGDRVYCDRWGNIIIETKVR
ncbi:MAG: Acetophenone carboxylase gamma subunit [Pelotomaculum sp. PtaB.Bin013]|uniref:Hydantoinase/oxoprolinase family protein n=1 Tax=Pelotomaculum isophthalicicum JI TaxID=947010 RepID=A0A9X4JVJ7_9FIRM|nr:hydantoinase/oxoprolinase family protein [Pelotomaculum isophthalicicum]MDF9408456.1 hydantoinase/oxoprolinase family protein [Pelotomaculum isophthalicicum JI]OPX87221.1 MAG: Acetophenone carboxylase gamma subunit [Pelotomaculum sp. PtaB.Bin013]